MQEPDVGSPNGSLRTLFQKGVRFGTIIDVGCADGLFCMTLFDAGIAPGAVPLNIDPNPLYEDSLRAIQETVGGHYQICAVTDYEGNAELTMSAHPYWASLRPHGDPYWERVNQLSTGKTIVPATTLDALRETLSLQPPFLLKLDVQGAELAALRGASQLLKDTHAVVCEADVDDFQSLNAAMVEQGFMLFDLTHIVHIYDGTLGWFYPIYVNRALDFVKPKAFWDNKDNENIIGAQIRRRNAVLKSNAEILARIRAARQSGGLKPQAEAIPRNALCPCGSGLKYKHCHGVDR